jgi:hypothetical protein
MSKSKVPCTISLGLSATNAPPDYQEEDTEEDTPSLPLIVKRKYSEKTPSQKPRLRGNAAGKSPQRVDRHFSLFFQDAIDAPSFALLPNDHMMIIS